MRKLALLSVLASLSGLSAGLASAKPWWLNGSTASPDDFLDPDVAFRPSSRVDGDVIHVAWRIADGYYLYRGKFLIEAESPGLVLDPPIFPRGIVKSDPYLGTQTIYTHSVEGTAHYRRQDAGAHPLQVRITYQGCAEAGLCYPPIVKVLFPGGAESGQGASPTAQGLRTDVPRATAHDPWVLTAIIGGGFAFLLAGFIFRRDRHLDFPA